MPSLPADFIQPEPANKFAHKSGQDQAEIAEAKRLMDLGEGDGRLFIKKEKK